MLNLHSTHSGETCKKKFIKVKTWHKFDTKCKGFLEDFISIVVFLANHSYMNKRGFLCEICADGLGVPFAHTKCQVINVQISSHEEVYTKWHKVSEHLKLNFYSICNDNYQVQKFSDVLLASSVNVYFRSTQYLHFSENKIIN